MERNPQRRFQTAKELYLALSGVMAGDPDTYYLLASDSGYGFVAKLGDMVTRNKAGKATLSVPKGCGVMPPVTVRDLEEDWIVAVTTEGRTWYSALDVTWNWRAERSWANVSYTWSQALNLGFDPLKGGISLPANSDDILAEKGRSDNDRRHRLVLAAETSIPWWGLRGSAVVQLMSGIPFNVVRGIDDNLDGFLTERPDGVSRGSQQGDFRLVFVGADRSPVQRQVGAVPMAAPKPVLDTAQDLAKQSGLDLTGGIGGRAE